MKLLIDLGTPIFSVCSVMPEPDNPNLFKILDSKIKHILVTLGATHFIAFVDGRGNFRKKVKSDYKANRDPSQIPESLDIAKQYCVERFKAVQADGIEADDAIAMTHTFYTKAGMKDMAIVSADKDMQQIPGLHFKIYKTDITRIEVSEQEAFDNLYNQMIQGDTADNIKGIKGFGPAKFDSLRKGIFDSIIGNTDIPAVESIRTLHKEKLQLLYLLEQYMFTYGTILGVEEFSKNFLTLYLKRELDYNFTIPKWKPIKHGKRSQ